MAWKLFVLSSILWHTVWAAPVKRGSNNDDDDDEIPAGFIVFLIVLVCSVLTGLLRLLHLLLTEIIIPSFRSIRLTNELPGEYDDEAAILEQDNRALIELAPNEQEIYFQTKDYLAVNPIDTAPITPSQSALIEEKGISAWEFRPNAAIVDEIRITDKTELNFMVQSSEVSIQTNLPVPHTAEVYYFECKIMSLPHPEDTLISIGIATSPYPYFQLPGRHRHSVSYESNGDRRYNQLFPLKQGEGLAAFPALTHGDIVGIGYRTRSGTIFFTRNGKKCSESKLGGHITNFRPVKFYPTIGATNQCAIHVNMGQRGFVFIEANVKKWGFAPLEGNGPPPPAYKTFNEDVLLESSSEYSDGEDSFPPNFWNATQASFTDNDDENITLNTMPAEPPLYRTDSEASASASASAPASQSLAQENERASSQHSLEHLQLENENIDDEGEVADDEEDV